uniref:Homeobox protein HBX4-like n=1 Tax=Tetracapsuloides bryosalmonae TaxID=271932 RepID=A0A859IQB5_9CNID|nr:homeobox protein HBX4-like [Tetracapsuloides bryosalmonae]
MSSLSNKSIIENGPKSLNSFSNEPNSEQLVFIKTSTHANKPCESSKPFNNEEEYSEKDANSNSSEQINNCAISARRNRRERTSYSREQLNIMEKIFESTKYPDVVIRKDLADSLSINESCVQIWFKNRRAKVRKSLKNCSKIERNAIDIPEHLMIQGKNLINTNNIAFNQAYGMSFKEPIIMNKTSENLNGFTNNVVPGFYFDPNYHLMATPYVYPQNPYNNQYNFLFHSKPDSPINSYIPDKYSSNIPMNLSCANDTSNGCNLKSRPGGINDVVTNNCNIFNRSPVIPTQFNQHFMHQ